MLLLIYLGQNLGLDCGGSLNLRFCVAAAVINLVSSRQVLAVIGTLTPSEVQLISDVHNDKITSSIHFISLHPTPKHPPLSASPRSQSLFYMGDDLSPQINCIAATVSHFRWQRVTAINEQNDDPSTDCCVLTHLSDSLRVIGSVIEHHSSFPRTFVEEELKKLKRRNNRVFIIIQSSLEFAILLFDKAKKLGMMEKDYAWIVSNDIASFLDSVDSPVISSMQGVIGIKADYTENKQSFREFKLKFRHKYSSEYPREEELSNPSYFALQAYDATWAVAKAIEKSQANINSKELFLENMLSASFEGLSANISIKKGSSAKTFKIINVVGRSYREIATWSLNSGFSVEQLGPIYWPGDTQCVPKGWNYTVLLGNKEKVLKVGVPARGAFNQFVRVSYDEKNTTYVTGFSVDVFEAVVKKLPYHLPYILVPFYGSYDDLVEQVYNKSLDVAVGDTEIMADRYQYVEFSQPYIESGLVMVVTTEPENSELWIFMKAFKTEMWVLMAVMSVFIGVVIWLIEHMENPEFRGSFCYQLGTMLWFSVTVLFFVQREPLKSNLSRIVLAPWLFVILIVTASFTASLTSMMTVSRLKPSVLGIETLRGTNAAVGCNGNSFIVRYLVQVLNFNPEKIKKINSIDEYPEAFKNGDIAAAFFVEPHAKVFLAKYCKGYIMTGPSFKLGGFGFVFPKGSPLVIDISEAILKATESGEIQRLGNDMFSSNCSSSNDIANDPTLGPGPFMGLFLITGGISAIAVLITVARLLDRRLQIVSCIKSTSLNIRSWRLAF